MTSHGPHHLAFRLVDQQGSAIAEGRRYELAWTDEGTSEPKVHAGITDDNGRTAMIETRGAVPVTLAIAPLAGGDCRPVARSVTSKPAGHYSVVTARLAFNAKATTAPRSQDHCETLTLRQGAQQVQYVIHNVPSVMNGGTRYSSSLRNLPYVIVDADTLEVLGSGGSRDEPGRFSGSATRVETARTAVDGVKTVGIVLGAGANGDPQHWREDVDNLVMYRVKPAAQGLTTVTITEKAEVGALPARGVPLTHVASLSDIRYTGTLNGRVWRTFTSRYTMADIRRRITGCLTLDTPTGTTTRYRVAQPSEAQIAWALAHGQISGRQADVYRDALDRGLTPFTPEEQQQWDKTPVAIRRSAPPRPPPLYLELAWADLLEPIYTGQFENVPESNRRRSQGGDIVIVPLGLTLRFQPGFSDNAEEFSIEEGQAAVLAHTHPYVYMMLLDACAQAGVTDVTIAGSWRPMLGSILHKLGDALDITRVDSRNDGLPAFTFSGGHVRNNALANRFSALLYEHRYARSAQHIYSGDDYPHGADGSHRNHLHITCNSRAPLHERDSVEYVGTADGPSSQSTPTEPRFPNLLPDWRRWPDISRMRGRQTHGQ